LPENDDVFWKIWEKFEVYHGNEDTYSDYLRIKRTVELRFSVIDPVQVVSDKQSLDYIAEQQKDTELMDTTTNAMNDNP